MLAPAGGLGSCLIRLRTMRWPATCAKRTGLSRRNANRCTKVNELNWVVRLAWRDVRVVEGARLESPWRSGHCQVVHAIPSQESVPTETFESETSRCGRERRRLR